MGDGLLIRRAEHADRRDVLRLLADALGWLPDEQHAAFFSWKHDRNPFGVSPAWVAIDEATGSIVGFRTFLRWEFRRGGDVVRAVRAVDTATHAAHRGRGIFQRLTLHALDELRDEGVAFVFNTPNDQSRPGYLKMGWKVVGRVPVGARVRSPIGALRLARARTAADLWSVPFDAGEAPQDVFTDVGNDVAPADDARLRTRRDSAFLAWRYAGFAPLAYRAFVHQRTGAVTIARLRRRGAALEATVGDVLSDREGRTRMAPHLLRDSGADYALATLATDGGISAFLPLPRQGPVLTWRALAESDMPHLESWRLVLGDVELF